MMWKKKKRWAFFRKVCSDREVIYCEWMDILAGVNVLVNAEWRLDRWAVRYFGVFFCFVSFSPYWVDSTPVIVLSGNFFRDWWWVAPDCFRHFVQVYLLRCFFCGCSWPGVGVCQARRAVAGKAVSQDERGALRDARFSDHWNKSKGEGGRVQVPEWEFIFFAFVLLCLSTVNEYLIAWCEMTLSACLIPVVSLRGHLWKVLFSVWLLDGCRQSVISSIFSRVF